jgi:hypothetical protein
MVAVLLCVHVCLLWSQGVSVDTQAFEYDFPFLSSQIIKLL